MSRLSKISLAPTPWPEEEERVWGYLVQNKLADAKEVALNCDVTEQTAQHCIDRIGTPREVFEKEELMIKAESSMQALSSFLISPGADSSVLPLYDTENVPSFLTVLPIPPPPAIAAFRACIPAAQVTHL